MSPAKKLLLALLTVVLVTASGIGLALAAPALGLAPGLDLAVVKVHDKQEGFRLFVPVPAGLVHLGVEAAASSGELARELAPARAELERWGPLLRETLDALGDAPDTVLVAVDTPTERVRVAKRGRKLHVSVRNPEADVAVAVPLTLLARIADTVRSSGPASAEI